MQEKAAQSGAISEDGIDKNREREHKPDHAQSCKRKQKLIMHKAEKPDYAQNGGGDKDLLWN